jgi:heme-degrading monooxygenase HmoA
MIRIVKMHFKPGNVEDFLALYKIVYPKITAMPGCESLQLLRDKYTPEILFTYSHWENEESLHHYRHSDLFVETWRNTKALFENKAEAWSVEEVEI